MQFAIHVYTVYMNVSTTARKILNAAHRLLDKDGADGVTMRRVAAAVGITPMAVYRHFEDRSALLNALANEGFDELAVELTSRRYSGNLDRRFTAVHDIYIEHALKHPRLFELMFLKQREGARQYPRDFVAERSPTANVMASMIREGMRSGDVKDVDVWEIVFAAGAFLEGLLMLYLGGRMNLSPAEFRKFSHRSLGRYLDGIRN